MNTIPATPKCVLALLCLFSVSCAWPALDSAPAQTAPPNTVMNITEVNSVLSEEKTSPWTINFTRVGGAGGTFKHLFFLNGSQGWAAGKSAVYKTDDGGRSWKPVEFSPPAGAEIADIKFINDSLGWMVLEKRAPDSKYRENHFWVFQTRDGGQTWQLNHEEQAALARQVVFSDGKNGWLTGVRYAGISPLRFNLLVLHTSDGGQHWADVSEGLNRLALGGKDSVNDWITGIVPEGQSEATLLTLRGKVFQTADSGRLWRQVANITGEPPQVCLCDLGIKTDGRLWVAGGAYSVVEGVGSSLLIENRKDSWTRYRLGGVQMIDVLFSQGDEIMAAGSAPADKTGRDPRRKEGTILYSPDGGHTWSIIYRDKQVTSFNKLAALGPEHIVALGEEGLVVRLQAPHPKVAD